MANADGGRFASLVDAHLQSIDSSSPFAQGVPAKV